MIKYICILSILFSNLSMFASNGSGGKTGLSFLKIGIDARAVGMGEAYTAVSSDASAVYWNPAGLLGARHSNVIFNHNEWIQGIRGEFAALSFVFEKSAWAFHVRSLNIGDIQIREIPTEFPLEETSAHYLSGGISYARKLSKNVGVGVTLKYLWEKIYVESAKGYAVDFGVVFQTPIRKLQLGYSFKNLGTMNNLRNESSKLPLTNSLGLMYLVPLSGENFSSLLSADIVKPSEEDLRIHLGTELIIYRELALRGGFLAGYEARNYSFGVGFIRSSIRFDYALTPFFDDLGTTHRFTINFIL